MPTNRKIIFINDGIYHVYNRGVERRVIFSKKREYARAFHTMAYYRFADLPIKYSKYVVLEKEKRRELFDAVSFANNKSVEILAFSLMPNHFHFLLQQKRDHGISNFISHFTNSYTKYFNIRNDRVGPLVQGVFKASYVENDEQLMHVSRYIHINPVVSSMIATENLDTYPWTSFHEYMSIFSFDAFLRICDIEPVLKLFSSREDYKKFIYDQVAYGKELEKIKHLCFDE